MNNKAIIRAIFILFALLLPASGQPQTINGKVVGVSDGDQRISTTRRNAIVATGVGAKLLRVSFIGADR
jgi:hypothetical protein